MRRMMKKKTDEELASELRLFNHSESARRLEQLKEEVAGLRREVALLTSEEWARRLK